MAVQPLPGPLARVRTINSHPGSVVHAVGGAKANHLRGGIHLLLLQLDRWVLQCHLSLVQRDSPQREHYAGSDRPADLQTLAIGDNQTQTSSVEIPLHQGGCVHQFLPKSGRAGTGGLGLDHSWPLLGN